MRIFSRNGSKNGYRKHARYSALSLFRHDLENTYDVVIIGAGVHGMSTAWHLAKELKARGRGSGEDVIRLRWRAAAGQGDFLSSLHRTIPSRYDRCTLA